MNGLGLPTRSLWAGAAPIGLGLLIVVCTAPLVLAFLFSADLSNAIFFVPQYVFPWSMTWSGVHPVPFRVGLDLFVWLSVAFGFSLITRRMARLPAFLVGIVVVAAVVALNHSVIKWLGFSFRLEGL